MIRIQCPKCEKILKIDESLAGSASSCPECGAKFRVPAPAADEEEHVAARPLPPPRLADEEPGEAEEEERPRRPRRFDVAPYRPDGGVSLPGLVLMTAVVLLAGVVLGVLASVVSHWFYLVLLFAAVIGLGLGLAGMAGVRLGKVRNPLVAGAVGFLGGCVASTSTQFCDYLSFLANREANRDEIELVAHWQQPPAGPGNAGAPPEAQPDADTIREAREMLEVSGFLSFIDYEAREGVTISRAASPSDTDKGTNLGHVGTYVYWFVEFLIMAGIAFAMTRSSARDPFCAECSTWKKHYRLALLDPEADEVVGAVEGGKVGRLADADRARGTDGLRVLVHVCPNCHDDAPVDVQVLNVTHDRRGREHVKTLAHVTYPGEALAVLDEAFPGKIGEKG